MSSGISSKPEQAGHGLPFVSFSIVFNNQFLPDTLPDLMDTSEEERRKYSVKEGDIFLTRTSETLDDLAMSSVVVKEIPNATYSGFLKRLRPTQTDISYHKFMAFYLRSELFRKTMKNNATMTLRASLNEQIFSYLDLLLPEYKDQKKIGDYLYLLNQKIELNNKVNAVLEAIARLVYDYWFVQFDFPDDNGKPYKSSGGKMVYNKTLKREIPEAWEVNRMKELLEKNTNKFLLNDEKYSIDTIDLSVMPSNTMCLTEKNSSDSFGTNLFKMKRFDILFGGIRPYLLKAGFAPFDGLNTGTVHSYSVKDKDEYNFALLTMTHQSMFNFAVANSKGTKMPVIGSDDLLEYKVPYNKEIVARLNKSLNFRDKISHNIIENQKLAELRDWLLPMLMNGQASVADSL
jgi:type I restriction enzyme S subunit